MWEKIINELKKDLIVILFYGLIVFFVVLDIYKDFIIALLLGLIAAAKLKVIISFFIRPIIKSIKSTASDLSTSKSNEENYFEPANEIEKIIVDSIIKQIKSDETKKSILDSLILEEIKEKNYLKNDWQIDYAKQRIKNTIQKHFIDNS